ncbi:MAG: hypothetical protein LUI01_02680, partial [Firmicutes bacterium]|nr:hypothetical protein [Bacillota bacterium]
EGLYFLFPRPSLFRCFEVARCMTVFFCFENLEGNDFMKKSNTLAISLLFGVAFGNIIGLLLGIIFFEENLGIGLVIGNSLGISLGLLVGLVINHKKDGQS